jgi:hypothetical protein
VLELLCIAQGPVGIGISCLDLLEELPAPRLVEPWPLDRFKERFGVDPRVPRELLPRSSIVLVVDHEEEVGGREEEIFDKQMRVMVSGSRAIVLLFVYYCAALRRVDNARISRYAYFS